MIFFSDLFGILAFRESALRSQADRRMFAGSIACFMAGCLAYDLVRNLVYADMPEIVTKQPYPGHFWFYLDPVLVLLFITIVYIPALMLFSRLISGKSAPDSPSFRDYRFHISALLPIWGLLFMIAAPVQYIVPHFLIVGMFEISVGYLIRTSLAVAYTMWTIKHLNLLTVPQASFVLVLSSIALPLLHFLRK